MHRPSQNRNSTMRLFFPGSLACIIERFRIELRPPVYSASLAFLLFFLLFLSLSLDSSGRFLGLCYWPPFLRFVASFQSCLLCVLSLYISLPLSRILALPFFGSQEVFVFVYALSLCRTLSDEKRDSIPLRTELSARNSDNSPKSIGRKIPRLRASLIYRLYRGKRAILCNDEWKSKENEINATCSSFGYENTSKKFYMSLVLFKCFFEFQSYTFTYKSLCIT